MEVSGTQGRMQLRRPGDLQQYRGQQHWASRIVPMSGTEPGPELWRGNALTLGYSTAARYLSMTRHITAFWG